RFLLGVGEGGGFTGAAAGDDAVGTVFELEIDHPAVGVVIDLEIVLERCRQCDDRPAKHDALLAARGGRGEDGFGWYGLTGTCGRWETVILPKAHAYLPILEMTWLRTAQST